MLIEKTGNIMSSHETSGFATQPNAPLRQMASLQTSDLKLPKSTTFNMFGKDGFTFFDMLDIINPLQHLPGISFLYRKITGDTIDPGSRIIGGTILGGPIGAIANLGDVILQRETGKNLVESATSLFLAKEQKKEINLNKTNATANTIGQETAKRVSPEGALGTPAVSSPRNQEDQGMSAMPISANKTSGKNRTSLHRQDPPELFTAANISTIDKINLETRFLEKQAFHYGKPAITPASTKNHLNSANTYTPDNKKKVFKNSLLSGLEKYHATIKLANTASLGHEALKITR